MAAAVTEIKTDYNDMIERISNLSFQNFHKIYVENRKPVIITDATQHWKAIDWTPETLIRKIGQQLIHYRTKEGVKTEKFDRLMRIIEDGLQPELYLRNIDIKNELPILVPDISPNLIYVEQDWRDNPFLPRSWLIPPNLIELFIGGPGTKFPVLHVDYWGMDGFISQVYGLKEFLIFSPEDSDYLYPSSKNSLVSEMSNFDEPDLTKFPLYKNATPIRFTLHPGETLYMPNGWWHTTRMVSVSFTVIQAFWNKHNWPILISELIRCSDKRIDLKTKIMTSYLSILEHYLDYRDKQKEK